MKLSLDIGENDMGLPAGLYKAEIKSVTWREGDLVVTLETDSGDKIESILRRIEKDENCEVIRQSDHSSG